MIMRLAVGVFAAVSAFAAFAKDLYVDDDADPSVADGTAAHPYAAIQDAVDVATGGDVIHVAEGVYATGGKKTGGSGCWSRVEIMGAKYNDLRLVGAGRGKSVIVGQKAESDYGFSSDNYRCICVWEASGVVVSGFTLRDGGTLNDAADNTEYNRVCGGGFYVYDRKTDVYLVDSDIDGCIGRCGGGAYAGTLVRCRIEDCGAANRGPAAARSVMINSLVVRNDSLTGSSMGALEGTTVYNCTLCDNNTQYATYLSTDKVYNSVLVLSSAAKEMNNASAVVQDSVLGSTASKGILQLLAPAAGDYRPLSSSDAVGAASYATLAGLSLPAGISALVDFDNKPIVADANGRIAAGCFQEAVTPAGGALYFSGKVSVDGVASHRSSPTYAYPAAYPTQYCVRPVVADGQRFFRFNRVNLDTGKTYQAAYPAVYPQLDGAAWMMPPPDPELTITNMATTATKVIWVDDDGSDENDGSEAHPYATLRKAAESLSAEANANNLVLVKPGHYRTDPMTRDGVGKFRLVFSSSGNISTLFRSVEGPGSTFIEGAADLSCNDATYPGCGPDAVRCVALSGCNAAIQGFTLTGGCSDGPTAATNAKLGAAVYGATGDLSRPQVLDCVISGNVATESTCTSAFYSRCRFVGNTGYKEIVNGGVAEVSVPAATHGGVVSFCEFLGNTVTMGGTYCEGTVGGKALVYNCTFVGTPKQGRLVSGLAEASFNSIYDGYQHTYSVSVLTNCILYNYGAIQGDRSNCILADPKFADRGINSLVRTGSPAVGGGCVPTTANYGNYFWRLAGGDIEGKRIAFTDGKPTVGASQHPVPSVGVAVTADARGGYTVSPAGGSAYVYAGKDLVFTAAGGKRLCIGMAVNGERRDFTNETPAAVTLSWSELSALGDGATVTAAPVYSTDLYVDDDGSDGNDGFTPDTAWKTLSTAAEQLAEGETLWVLPGTYKTGSTAHKTGVTVRSRVVVKSNRKVISTDGAERTFIVGEPAKAPDDYGCGTDGVRGAYLEQNSLLRGFTVTGGRCCNDDGGNLTDNNAGGGIDGGGRGVNALADSCIISNNVARFGGAVARCDVANSLVVGNRALYRASAFRQANAYNCLVRGNVGGFPLDYCNEILNCTVLGDNVSSSSKILDSMGGDNQRICNSLFCGKVDVPASATVTSSAFGPDSVIRGAVVGDDVTIAASIGELAVDEDGVPVIGANLAAVDRGDASLLKDIIWTDVDLRGEQRVLNGRMDIGCFEADWRPRYAKDLHGGRRLTVGAVSPAVKEENGIVTIPSGSLAATLTGDPAKDKLVRVRVTGNGTLDIVLNGALFASVTAADEIKDLRFANGLAENALTFTYRPGAEDAGCAELLRVSEESGLCLIFR